VTLVALSALAQAQARVAAFAGVGQPAHVTLTVEAYGGQGLSVAPLTVAGVGVAALTDVTVGVT